ncbi:MAG: thioesterase [Fibrobacter sp.]|nr:thioesterase [Fibrobacter sp.]
MIFEKLFGKKKQAGTANTADGAVEVAGTAAKKSQGFDASSIAVTPISPELMANATRTAPNSDEDDTDEITELKFTVRFSDCDEHNRLKLSRLFQFTEEAALSDAERKGYGLWNMMKAGYGCVVTRMKLRLNHTPVLGEELLVSTWAKENYKDKVIYKDYRVCDGRGNILVEGTSSWLLVDLKTGKAVPPSTSPFPLPIEEGREALPSKLDILSMGLFPKVVDQVQGRNTDLDINHHVNHCRYVDWVLDALTREEVKDRGIRSIQMNYIHQIPLDEKVDIVRFRDSKHHAVLFGMNAEEMKKNPLKAKCHFQARVGFSR